MTNVSGPSSVALGMCSLQVAVVIYLLSATNGEGFHHLVNTTPSSYLPPATIHWSNHQCYHKIETFPSLAMHIYIY